MEDPEEVKGIKGEEEEKATQVVKVPQENLLDKVKNLKSTQTLNQVRSLT